VADDDEPRAEIGHRKPAPGRRLLGADSVQPAQESREIAGPPADAIRRRLPAERAHGIRVLDLHRLAAPRHVDADDVPRTLAFGCQRALGGRQQRQRFAEARQVAVARRAVVLPPVDEHDHQRVIGAHVRGHHVLNGAHLPVVPRPPRIVEFDDADREWIRGGGRAGGRIVPREPFDRGALDRFRVEPPLRRRPKGLERLRRRDAGARRHRVGPAIAARAHL
jgi:hypothetical protein